MTNTLESLWNCKGCGHSNHVKGEAERICAQCGLGIDERTLPLVPPPPAAERFVVDQENELVTRVVGPHLTPDKPRIVIVDVRNGNVLADGRNINVPEEGQLPMLRAIEMADVLVTVDDAGMWVKYGVEKGWVTMITTKSEGQMNAEKAAGELAHRVKKNDDLERGDHPVDVKFARVWNHATKPTRTGF